MTRELWQLHERATAAERVGDAEEALEYHRGIPMFQRSRHRALLEQLVAASGELTPWAWARWIVYQALRAEDPGTRTSRLLRGARSDALTSFHTDLMQAAYDERRDPVKVAARVMGESWASHQLATYEYGVLTSFLDELAGGELEQQAGLARSWADAPMGGYRIEGPGIERPSIERPSIERPSIERSSQEVRRRVCTVTVRDLGSDQTHDVLDLGSSVVPGPGRCVLGRLVPSGTRPRRMFDTVPLAVDEDTARKVARSTGDSWADALLAAIASGRLDGGDLLREDYELMSDVPPLSLLEFGTRPTDLARAMSDLMNGRDEVGRAAFRILRSASTGALDDAAAPYVASAVLNVRGYAEAQRAILAPGQHAHWLRWAELTPDPAQARLLRFAEQTATVA
jgi:hypothetical protein